MIAEWAPVLMIRYVIALLLVLGSGACANPDRLSATSLAGNSVEVPGYDASTDQAYRIGVGDVLNVTVFQVEDLTMKEVAVDASGELQLPLIGGVRAAGLTPVELSEEVSRRLNDRYLRNAQVSVTVADAASQKITVDGAVTKPGVYKMQGRTTLLQAVAMAEGPTRVADLTNVAVFRTIEGRRTAALFNLAQIRAGRMADPYVQGDDVVVVDTSRLNANLRELLQALPGLAVFGYL